MDRYIEHKLAASERPKVLYQYYVTGSGQFPVDMLRFDACWPATGEDAAKMTVSNKFQGETNLKS